MQIISSLNYCSNVPLTEDRLLTNYCGLAGGKTTPTIFMAIKPDAFSDTFSEWIEQVYNVQDGKRMFQDVANDWSVTLNIYSSGSKVKCCMALGGVVNGIVKQSQPLDVYLNQEESKLIDKYACLIYQSYANGTATRIA